MRDYRFFFLFLWLVWLVWLAEPSMACDFLEKYHHSPPLENYAMAISEGEAALLDSSLEQTEKADIHAILASTSFYMGDYGAMQRHAESCIHLADDVSDSARKIKGLYLLSAAFRGQQDYSRARETILLATGLLDDHSSRGLIAKVYFNAGAAFADADNPDFQKALNCYEKGLIHVNPDSDQYARFIIRIANCYWQLGDGLTARYLLSSLAERDLPPRTLVQWWRVAAPMYIAAGNYAMALSGIHQGMAIAEKQGMKNDMKALNHLKSLIFAMIGAA